MHKLILWEDELVCQDVVSAARRTWPVLIVAVPLTVTARQAAPLSLNDRW